MSACVNNHDSWLRHYTPVRVDRERAAILEPDLGEDKPAHVGAVPQVLETKGHVEVKLLLRPG